MDLDIANYNLTEILNLFDIPHDFTEDHLLKAKKKVVTVHPDKSKLNPEYFRFYFKAYKILLEIWEFRNQSKKSSSTYQDTLSDERTSLLNNYFKDETNKKNFNKMFNEEFDKRNLIKKHGYHDWLKDNNDECDAINSKNWNDANKYIESKKASLRQVILHENIQEYSYGSMGSSLDTNEVGNYSSEMFSNLMYEDLQKAHTETVVPVTNDDFNNRFNNLEELNMYRSSQNYNPLTEKECNNYYHKQEQNDSEKSTRLAFNLAKECEIQRSKEQEFFKNMRRLM